MLVVVVAITVALAVRLVVLRLVADEVVEREPVVGGDELMLACGRRPPGVQVGRAV